MNPVKYPKHQVAVREIIVDNTKYRVRSVFAGQTSLDDALTKIIMKKLENKKAA